MLSCQHLLVKTIWELDHWLGMTCILCVYLENKVIAMSLTLYYITNKTWANGFSKVVIFSSFFILTLPPNFYLMPSNHARGYYGNQNAYWNPCTTRFCSILLVNKPHHPELTMSYHHVTIILYNKRDTMFDANVIENWTINDT